MGKLTENFGELVFNDRVMREKLPSDIYKSLKKTIRDGKDLDITLANVVANAMKVWAIEKGATHYTHWFQPLTGVTAEKHDSFLQPAGDGSAIEKVSGKNLIKGEPDASSFPSGGLRATFEARGYTAWDPTSYAFIKDDTLCIPTAFCSYGGEMLDKKTPLLRSVEQLSDQAVRVLRALGRTDVTRVISNTGAEQEYFILDKEAYRRRPDLVFTGRTLYGAPAPKGQELDDHYFGVIKPRVKAFMSELDRELWKLGIFAATEHNEGAPSQHELAPVFSVTNLAADHNQLTMEIMKKVARRHGLVCILTEKPFAGVNGSGKHNNWSLKTDTGVNLLEPGDTPHENAQFLLFLVAVIKAVDEYQDLLRISIASAGNDHRLGAQEAPPAIVSMFLGDELTEILESLDAGTSMEGKEKTIMRVGVHAIPYFHRDTTDRNRTSPFAFTGNKFEFRMPGSSASISTPNVCLNSAVADVLRGFADELEGAHDFEAELHELIRKEFHAHKRIVFNGNGYDDAWLKEAKKRGLSNYPSTVDALPHMLDEKNVELYQSLKVLSLTEIQSRYEVALETYSKKINIEAKVMVDMARKQILPAVTEYQQFLADTLNGKRACGMDLDTTYEEDTLSRIAAYTGDLFNKLRSLEEDLPRAQAIADNLEKAKFFRSNILRDMEDLRNVADTLEGLVSHEYWPFPNYTELLFSV